MVRVLAPVTSPTELSKRSKPRTVKPTGSPATAVADPAVIVMRVIEPSANRTLVLALTAPTLAVIVRVPGVVDVHVAPLHDPLGAMVRSAWPVTSPRSVPVAER